MMLQTRIRSTNEDEAHFPITISSGTGLGKSRQLTARALAAFNFTFDQSLAQQSQNFLTYQAALAIFSTDRYGYKVAVPAGKSETLEKMRRRRRDALAGVYLDQNADSVLMLLNRVTAISWEELQRSLGIGWPETCRGVAMLASAGLCDVGSSTLRLSEFGDGVIAARRSNT